MTAPPRRPEPPAPTASAAPIANRAHTHAAHRDPSRPPPRSRSWTKPGTLVTGPARSLVVSDAPEACSQASAASVRSAVVSSSSSPRGGPTSCRLAGMREQMLRRAGALDALNPVAACHHEKADGSGYAKGLASHQLSPAARILGAADRYQAMTQRRAHRPALSPAAAAAELRRMAAAGEADADAAECVLTAAGHAPRRRSAALPAGLTAREAEVLALAASGLTTAQIAQRLVISPKTADSHIQHIYAKIGCSTRGAAVLFALNHHLADHPPS